MRTSGRPRSAHSRCTCSHRGPAGSHATVTDANPFALARVTPSPAPRPAGTPSPAPSCGPAPAHHDQSPRSPACPPPGRSRSPRHRAAAPAAAAPGARSASADPRHPTAATLAHTTSALVALGTPSPHYRTRRTSPPQPLPAQRAPLARCPITTPYLIRPYAGTLQDQDEKAQCRAAGIEALWGRSRELNLEAASKTRLASCVKKL